MKTLHTLALAAIVGFALSACGPANEPAPKPEQKEDAPAVAAPAEATPAPEAPAESAPAAEPAESSSRKHGKEKSGAEWVSFFNGKNLDGLTQRGAATWEVVDGVLTGKSPGGQGHIYGGPELTDLEVKGMFKITPLENDANSGLYFRANPPEDNVDGYPKGYEAQICNSQDAFTGWLWKPGSPTGEATKNLAKDGEWFSMRVKAVGKTIQIWVEDELVMTYEDEEYKKGSFAIQCHNDGMIAEAKELFYRDLSAK
jgi:hypothetical protein